MTWRIEFAPAADRELDKLDRPVAKRIVKFLYERIAPLDDPRSIGKPLKGSQLGEFWRYRVGDYRVIVRIENTVLLVLVLRIGHRKTIYKG